MENNKIDLIVYKNILENIRDAFLVAQDGQTKYANLKMLNLLGYDSVKELISKDFSAFIHPDDYPKVLSNHNRRLRGEQFDSVYEFSVRHKNGKYIPVEIRVAVLEWEGRPATLNFLIDISSRKQAEEALRASEEKYRNLYRYSALGIFHSTFEGRFIDVNPALAKMLGYDSPEEAVSLITSISEQIYADPPKRDEIKARALEEGGIIRVENNYRRRDGTPWHGMLHLRIVPDQLGRPSHYEGFVEDITHRKQSEQILRLHSEIMTNIAEGIILARVKDSIIVYVNPKMEEMFGYGSGELIDKHNSIINAHREKSSAGESPEIFSPLLEQGMWQGEVICKKKDGALFWCSANISTFHHAEHGKVWVAAYSNITQRKAIMAELESSYRQLRVLNQRWIEIEELERKRLSAELHDEIGQNLTALGINFGIVKMNLSPGADSLVTNRIDDSLQLLKRSSVQIKSIMSNLRPPLLDDYGLVSALHWHVQESAQRTGIKISCVADNLPVRPATEIETALFRIAQEAVNNSIKHARPNCISLTLNYAANRLYLAIVDDGIGFEVQAIAGKCHHGWGLMIIKERCIGIRGLCRIESQTGRGTKIAVEVPL